MPGPGLYVVAVVVGVAAGIAFKEFVYDPHLAPKIEQWTGAYAAYRIERRRRRASSHSRALLHSDNEGEIRSLATTSNVELESLVEREMDTLGEASLRQRKLPAPEAKGLEMMEKPNTFIPFAPLSPSPLIPLPKTALTREDVTIPIGRLPSSTSDHTFSRRVSASPARSTDAILSQIQPPTPMNPFASSATYLNPASQLSSSEVDVSQGTSPFTSASVSRAGTPWTDAPSESVGLQSGASFSSDSSESSFVSDIEHPYPNLDASLLHATTYSQTSLNNQSAISLDEHSEASFDTSISPSIDTRSDVSLDLLESEGDQQAELVDIRSPRSTHGILSDEEWERVSEPGRSAHQ